MRRAQALAQRGPALLLGAHGLVFGCAPAQSFRPASALTADRQAEVGVALASVGSRPYVEERARPMAQGWWSSRLGRRWQSSVLLGFDQSALLAGGALRFLAAQGRFWAAAEVEAGFAWAAVSLPVAVELWQPLGLYCSPRVGNWGVELSGFVPCGASIELGSGLVVRVELQLSWAGFAYYNRREHVGLGLIQQW